MKKIKSWDSNRYQIDGSNFEPSNFILLELHLIFFTSSPAKLAVYKGDVSLIYTASLSGLEANKTRVESVQLGKT